MQTSQASTPIGGEASKQSAPQQSGAATVVTRVLLLKPLKRPPSTESAGVVAKKAKQGGAASAATGAGWCSDCWARAQDACRGAHRLVGLATAQKNVAAELTAAERSLQRVKQRMRSLKEAVLSSAPVLLADVPYVGEEAPYIGEPDCWSVGGVTVRIALASTAPLTAEDVEAVCEALEGLELEYVEDGGMPTAWVPMDIDGLESVLGKLPDQEGQTLQKGDLQLDAQGRLTVVGERGEYAKGKAGIKLLGRVDKYDDLNARSCGWGRSCKYARQGYHQNFGKGTTFEDVRLAE